MKGSKFKRSKITGSFIGIACRMNNTDKSNYSFIKEAWTEMKRPEMIAKVSDKFKEIHEQSQLQE